LLQIGSELLNCGVSCFDISVQSLKVFIHIRRDSSLAGLKCVWGISNG
jgi:hypothetical protein